MKKMLLAFILCTIVSNILSCQNSRLNFSAPDPKTGSYRTSYR
jgi:hypothetical protein